MEYYPIIIPTLNRFDHFKRCVSSLSQNTYASETELVIGLDYPPSEKYFDGYNKIKNYIPTISGFKKVTIFYRTENLGPERNWEELKKYAFENNNAVICSEDDNEFSPCFLDYMDKMLEFYKDNPAISSVSGYLPYSFDINKKDYQVIFTPEANGWGMGLWKNKETDEFYKKELVYKIIKSYRLSIRNFISYPASFRMALTMIKEGYCWGDVIRTQCNIFNNRFQVRPNISLCRNWGHDGTGLHCTRDFSYEEQQISNVDFFEFLGQDAILLPIIKKIYRTYLLPQTIVGKLRFLASTILKHYDVRKRIIKSYREGNIHFEI